MRKRDVLEIGGVEKKKTGMEYWINKNRTYVIWSVFIGLPFVVINYVSDVMLDAAARVIGIEVANATIEIPKKRLDLLTYAGDAFIKDNTLPTKSDESVILKNVTLKFVNISSVVLVLIHSKGKEYRLEIPAKEYALIRKGG